MRKRFHPLYALNKLFGDIGRESLGSYRDPLHGGAELKLLYKDHPVFAGNYLSHEGESSITLWLGGVNHNIGEGVMTIVTDSEGLKTLKQVIDGAVEELR